VCQIFPLRSFLKSHTRDVDCVSRHYRMMVSQLHLVEQVRCRAPITVMCRLEAADPDAACAVSDPEVRGIDSSADGLENRALNCRGEQLLV